MFPIDIKILVVDDTYAARALIRSFLLGLGYKNVFEAVDGLDAIHQMTKQSEETASGEGIQLVIADWNMPRMNGLDLLINLKQNSRYDKIPFLMVTAESDVSFVTLALCNGADAFVVKPFDEEILKEKLSLLWKRTQAVIV